jgi:hypothetical protein
MHMIILLALIPFAIAGLQVLLAIPILIIASLVAAFKALDAFVTRVTTFRR